MAALLFKGLLRVHSSRVHVLFVSQCMNEWAVVYIAFELATCLEKRSNKCHPFNLNGKTSEWLAVPLRADAVVLLN